MSKVASLPTPHQVFVDRVCACSQNIERTLSRQRFSALVTIAAMTLVLGALLHHARLQVGQRIIWQACWKIVKIGFHR